MQIVPLESVPETLFIQPRQGQILTRNLLNGEDGSSSNFVLYTNRTDKDFFSPRHTHNFDQVRFQIEGYTDFKTGRLTAGKVGYFPEGTAYGPQTSGDDSVMLLLQFGGASGDGYMPHDKLKQAVEELSRSGEFHSGVYTYLDENGRKFNKDGYQAAWEYLNGRKLTYAKPRFDHPVFMDPDSFEWLPVPGISGVYRKKLGEFNQGRTSVSFVRLDAQTSYAIPGGKIVFVVAGAGEVGTHVWKKHACIHLVPGETGEFQTHEPAELLVIGLPIEG